MSRAELDRVCGCGADTPSPAVVLIYHFTICHSALRVASHCFGTQHNVPRYHLTRLRERANIRFAENNQTGDLVMRYIGLWLLGVPVIGIVGLKVFGLI